MWYRTIGRMTNLVDFFRLESVLQDLEIPDELVFMFGIHLHSAHWDVACRQKRVKKCVSARLRGVYHRQNRGFGSMRRLSRTARP